MKQFKTREIRYVLVMPTTLPESDSARVVPGRSKTSSLPKSLRRTTDWIDENVIDH